MKKYESKKFYFVSEEKVKPYRNMSTFNANKKNTLNGKVEYSIAYKLSGSDYIDLLDGKIIKQWNEDSSKVGEKVITYETLLFNKKKKVDLIEVLEGYNEIIKYIDKKIEIEKKEVKELSKKMCKIIKQN